MKKILHISVLWRIISYIDALLALAVLLSGINTNIWHNILLLLFWLFLIAYFAFCFLWVQLSYAYTKEDKLYIKKGMTKEKIFDLQEWKIANKNKNNIYLKKADEEYVLSLKPHLWKERQFSEIFKNL